MSTKTTFKRIALVAVAALGLGVLSVAPSSAAITEETFTVSAATATATVGDTATVTVTNTFIASAASPVDSRTISAVVQGVGNAGTATINLIPTTDSANTILHNPANVGTAYNVTESVVAVTAGAYTKAGFTLQMINFTVAGTYIVTITTKDGVGTIYKSTLVTVTVTAAASNTATGASLYVSADADTAFNGRLGYKAYTDSAVVASAGTIATPVIAAYAYPVVTNSAGDTRSAGVTGIKNSSTGTAVVDTLTVTVSGPGLVTGNSSTKSKSATVQAWNSAGFTHGGPTSSESFVVWSDGTAGTATIYVSGSSGVVFKSFTVTFTGTPASAAIALSDTIVSLTAGSTIVGTVKDSGGNVMKSGTVYVYSSDTKVAGTDLSTNVYPTKATGYTIPSTGVLAYTLTTTDTGVATITLRDSWTVAASTWTSNEVVVTVTGSTVATLTVAFDKATYAPGERAVITYTAKDIAGKALATAAATLTSTLNNATLGEVTGGAAPGGSFANRASTLAGFQSWMDSGIETRVVTMPTYAGAVNLSYTFPTFGSTTGAVTTASATATVVDANAVAAAAATAAAKDASDAATDAALEATDAAYAATDAANIAAEAADAATAAAEAATEAANAAKESADAATAAVEELATSVAKLMAALQAQITTLAKVVAKIAVKVKA